MHLTIPFYHTCYFICKCNEGYQIYTAVEYDFSDLMSLRVTVMFHFGSAKFTMNFTNKSSPYLKIWCVKTDYNYLFICIKSYMCLKIPGSLLSDLSGREDYAKTGRYNVGMEMC